MRLSRARHVGLTALAWTVFSGAACGGETEAPLPDIAAPERDAATGPPSLPAAVDGGEAGTVTSSNVVAVTKAGNGTGSVTSSPDGILCGATCSAGFAASSTVTLTAAPESGSTFTGWAGAGCSGTNPVCELTIPPATEAIAMDVIATFDLEKQVLTVSKIGTGTGTVVSTPAGIDCGGTCTASIDHGTVVQLSATPAMGSSFSGWSGACTGTGACSVSMTTARSVTASFSASAGLTCSTVSTAASCTNAQIAEINLGALNGSSCHDQCQTKLAQAGVTTGCWIVAFDTNCYCRGGVLNLGGSRAGGSCN